MTLDAQKLAQLLTSISAFSAALKARLEGKLDLDGVAANTTLFEGKTLATIKSEIAALSSADLAVVQSALAAHIARTDNPHGVTKAQTGLGNVDNYATATNAEALAGLATDKFLVAANLGAFWADKVGAAPETLDTIAEIAAALQNNPAAITALQTIASNNSAAITALQSSKLDKTAKAADSALFDGKTHAEIIAEAQAGVDLSQVVLKSDDISLQKIGETTAGAVSTLATANAAAIVDLTDVVASNSASIETKLGQNSQAVDSAQLEGQSLAQLLASIRGGDLQTIQAVQDNLETYIAGVVTLQKAGTAEALAGIDDVKYITAVGLKAKVDAAITDVVGGAPEALDTLKELADALANQDDAVSALVITIGTKLGKNEQAANSALLEGKSVADIVAEAQAGVDLSQVVLKSDDISTMKVGAGTVGSVAAATTANAAAIAAQTLIVTDNTQAITTKLGATAQAVDSAKLEGKTKAQVIAEAVAAVDLTGKLDKTAKAADSALLDGQTLAAILASVRGGEIETIQAVQDALDLYIGGVVTLQKATGAEAIAGTDDVKFITSLALKAKVDAAVSALVDGAPTALDTLKELADALADGGDAVAALTLVVNGKLGKTEQAADSLKLNGKTQAELTASNAEVTTGTATDKFVTPASLASKTSAQDLAIAANATAIEDVVNQLIASFDTAATSMDL